MTSARAPAPRPTVEARPFVSAQRGLALRIAAALALGFVSTCLLALLVVGAAHDALRAQKMHEATLHFAAAIRQVDERFLAAAQQFTALLEQGKVLEGGPEGLAPARFVAFATAFGRTQDFSAARIVDGAGQTLFSYKADTRTPPELPLPAGSSLGWVFDKGDRTLYRTVRSAVGPGSQAAELVLYAPVDARVLGAMAYPMTAIRLHREGVPIASADPLPGPPGPAYADIVSQEKTLPWEEGSATTLAVVQRVVLPVSAPSRVFAIVVSYALVALLVWGVLGRWLRAQARRLASISAMAEGYRAQRGLKPRQFAELQNVAMREYDEIGRLAGTFAAMARRTDEARFAQQEAARGLKIAWQQRANAEQRLEENAVRFQTVAAASRTYVWEFDTDLDLVYASEGVEAVLGYTPEERMAKGTCANGGGVTGPMQAPIREATRRCLREGVPFRGIEVELLHRDGHIVHALCAGVPVFDDSGGIRGVMGTSTEIGEFKRSRDRLDQLLASTGSVAHEFNRLLGVIVDNLDTLGEKAPGDRHQVAALKAALEGVRIARSLLDEHSIPGHVPGKPYRRKDLERSIGAAVATEPEPT